MTNNGDSKKNESLEWRDRWFKSLDNNIRDIKDSVSSIRNDVVSSNIAAGKSASDLQREINSVRDDLSKNNIEFERRCNELKTNVQETKIDLMKEISEIRSEVTGLKVKAGIWGTIGASIPAGIIVMMQFWK